MTKLEGQTNEGYIPVTGGKVYYRSFGHEGKTPLLTLHGGPGFSHDLLLNLKDLAVDRQVIFYDQLGSGKSDRPQNLSLYSVDRFVEELAQVRKALNLDKVILWGGSWGTMLAVDYMLTKPSGVEALILSNPCLSARRWKEDADRLRKMLPQDVQKVLLQHEAQGTTDSEEYQKAMWEYLKRFVIRMDPIPQDVMDAFNDANMDVYKHMWGPSEFCPTGTLKGYDRTANLSAISVPTLFICGEHDEATPETTKAYTGHVTGATSIVIDDASHCTLLEKPQEYLKAMRDFLIQLNGS